MPPEKRKGTIAECRRSLGNLSEALSVVDRVSYFINLRQALLVPCPLLVPWECSVLPLCDWICDAEPGAPGGSDAERGTRCSTSSASNRQDCRPKVIPLQSEFFQSSFSRERSTT